MTRDPENLHAQNTTPKPNNERLPTPPRVWSINNAHISCNKPNFVAAITRQTLPSTVVNMARERKEESRFLNGVIQGSPALITPAAAALGQQGNGTRLQIPSFSQRWNQLFFAANISTRLLSRPVMSAALIFFNFYNSKILQLFKIKCLLCHHECISVLMNQPCIEYCSCRGEVWSRTCL